MIFVGTKKTTNFICGSVRRRLHCLCYISIRKYGEAFHLTCWVWTDHGSPPEVFYSCTKLSFPQANLTDLVTTRLLLPCLNHMGIVRTYYFLNIGHGNSFVLYYSEKFQVQKQIFYICTYG